MHRSSPHLQMAHLLQAADSSHTPNEDRVKARHGKARARTSRCRICFRRSASCWQERLDWTKMTTFPVMVRSLRRATTKSSVWGFCGGVLLLAVVVVVVGGKGGGVLLLVVVYCWLCVWTHLSGAAAPPAAARARPRPARRRRAARSPPPSPGWIFVYLCPCVLYSLCLDVSLCVRV